jgi:hypothetical protein
MTDRIVHTPEQALDAIRALGYDPEKDRIMSVLVDVQQVSVRRLAKREAGSFAIVEDRTILKPRDLDPQDHNVQAGPLEGQNTSPEAGQGG